MYNNSMVVSIHSDVKVADEVFLVLATMHREAPSAEDFSIGEILERGVAMNLTGTMRPGFKVHVQQHVVANKPPNPGAYRMLFETTRARRRLLRKEDPVHPDRGGKIWPDPREVPTKYHDLIAWAKLRYGERTTSRPWLDALADLRGSGEVIWRDEPADDYLRRLRDGWV